MEIEFTKMHGCGNDFIMIDNRKGVLKDIPLHDFVKKLCERKFNIGANGLMLVENSSVTDFRMRYFNADGSEGEMCGNGARCIAKYAWVNGIVSKKMMSFETLDGNYRAKVLDNGQVEIYFPEVMIKDVCLQQKLLYKGKPLIYHYGSVGVPHTVYFSEDIEEMNDTDFKNLGRSIRYDKAFSRGTNVNGVRVLNQNEIAVRTYERGVEEETLACGSGATASAIISSLLHYTKPPIHVKTRGGYVIIDFKICSELVEFITLTGNAEIVFEGTVIYKTS
ncbi:diaminopimelate epimerase [Pseudogracilibacillus sp. SE30717A]|uniref:diaminopimelate epimerase n=1 Tax=Pseudogracilibacillus sp. SE30717A TaxID=3098293 RepID=UPI00300DD15B